MTKHHLSLSVVLLVSMFMLGCGPSGPQVVPIQGVATHNGEPVPNIRIYFIPTDGRPSWGITDEGGRFTLDYDPEHKGAKVGTHKVEVIDEGSNIDPTAAMSGAPRPKRSSAIGEIVSKYGRGKSTLEVEVKKADRNFQLKLD
jgi:hypothetical protein